MLLPIYVSVEDKSNNSATGIVFSQKCSEEKWLTIYAVKTVNFRKRGNQFTNSTQ